MALFDDNELVSREELLEGRLARGRRANALLFAVESRTAQLVAQSKVATELYPTKKATDLDLAPPDGQVMLPAAGEACELEFALER
jgi:hypothetical protein